MMVLNLPALTSHGQKQPKNLEHQSSSPRVVTVTPYAPSPPLKTTSTSTPQSQPLPLNPSPQSQDINSSIPASSTLFAYQLSSGEPKNLLKTEFLKFVTGIWSSAMLAHVLRHSFHISRAVKLLLAGVPPEIVAATGGWTSLAFLLYWRCMDEILPMSTSKAYNQAHLHCLASIFEEFHISHKIPSALLDKFTYP